MAADKDKPKPFLQTIAPSASKIFYQKFSDLERYAIDNDLDKPKMGDLLELLFTKYISKVSPEDYFKAKK